MIADLDTAYDRDAEREPFTPILPDPERDARLLSGTCWRCASPATGLADDGMGRFERACDEHTTRPHDDCCEGSCRHCPRANRR